MPLNLHRKNKLKRETPERLRRMRPDDLIMWGESCMISAGQAFDSFRHNQDKEFLDMSTHYLEEAIKALQALSGD